MRKNLLWALALTAGLTLTSCSPTQKQKEEYRDLESLYNQCEQNLIINNRVDFTRYCAKRLDTLDKEVWDKSDLQKKITKLKEEYEDLLNRITPLGKRF